MYTKYEKTEMSPINLIMINGPNKKIVLPPIQKVMSCFQKSKIISALSNPQCTESCAIRLFSCLLGFVNSSMVLI
jgi:hypothetical protein